MPIFAGRSVSNANGVKKNIAFIFIIFFSCEKELVKEPIFCDSYKKGEIAIGLKSVATIEAFFKLINNYGLVVDKLSGVSYESSLPSDSIDYVIRYLNSKKYINTRGFKAVKDGSVSLHYQTKALTINCVLFDMSTENQEDWNETKTILRMKEKPSNTRYFVLNVPINEEKNWVRVFYNNDDVSFAELNCYIPIKFN